MASIPLRNSMHISKDAKQYEIYSYRRDNLVSVEVLPSASRWKTGDVMTEERLFVSLVVVGIFGELEMEESFFIEPKGNHHSPVFASNHDSVSINRDIVGSVVELVVPSRFSRTLALQSLGKITDFLGEVLDIGVLVFAAFFETADMLRSGRL
jgi:hypothetical protein